MFLLSNFQIVEFRFLCVIGTAYIHGVKHATGNYVIIMDADLSHHVICLFYYKASRSSLFQNVRALNQISYVYYVFRILLTDPLR